MRRPPGIGFSGAASHDEAGIADGAPLVLPTSDLGTIAARDGARAP